MDKKFDKDDQEEDYATIHRRLSVVSGERMLSIMYRFSSISCFFFRYIFIPTLYLFIYMGGK